MDAMGGHVQWIDHITSMITTLMCHTLKKERKQRQHQHQHQHQHQQQQQQQKEKEREDKKERGIQFHETKPKRNGIDGGHHMMMMMMHTDMDMDMDMEGW
jgi:FKBP-type peptidyl-prolyl cis-trans isomerase